MTVQIQEMNHVAGSMYYECERCGRVKEIYAYGDGRVPVCSRCRTQMTLRVIEQLELGLEFPEEVTPRKETRPRLQVIDGGKV